MENEGINSVAQDEYFKCQAYMKTKLFMAKRIAELQNQVEVLKEQVFYYSNKYSQLNDLVISINENLAQKTNIKIFDNQDKLDISGHTLKSIELDQEKANNNKNRNFHSTENQADQVLEDDIDHGSQAIINLVKSENLVLRQTLEKLNCENIEKNLKINKLSYDRYILFSELEELVNSLKTMDLNKLNEFYLDSGNQINHNSKENCNLTSSMGLKYNILSAQAQMLLTENTNSFYKEYLSSSNNCKKSDSKIVIETEKYFRLLKFFEDEISLKSDLI